MAMQTGTHDVGVLFATNNQSVAQFGIDKAAAILAADLARFNAIVRADLMASLVTPTTDRQGVYGISNTGTMMEMDEYGRGPTQVEGVPPTGGFPLRMYQFPVGWTEIWMKNKTPRDLAIMNQNGQQAYLALLRREIKKAFFLSANYTFIDKLVDKVSLAVKRLLNADSAAIPNGPNGEVFTPSSHTHYTFEAALSASGLTAAINNVIEHGVTGPVVVAISATDEATVRALTGFTAAIDPRLIPAPGGTVNLPNERLNTLVLNNRMIGFFGATEVWTKPWAIANYAVVYDQGSAERPLVMRERSAGSGGLVVAAEISMFPLTAKYQQAEFGIAVWSRTKMAVHYFASGSAYADPTITS